MTRSSLFLGLDGLMTLSRRDGVDIRPTLLRVLTDLYVQASAHSADEERQFIELASRLIDEVDDATRAAVCARLAIYPSTPTEILRKLGLRPTRENETLPQAAPIPASMLPKPAVEPRIIEPSPTGLSMQPKDAAELCEMFFGASASERTAILQSLADTPLKPAMRIPEHRASRAIEALEMAAFVSDVENFTAELGESLQLSSRIAAQIVDDDTGEPLACAAKALGMPSAAFQRVLLFLKPELGQSVQTVFRLSRLYERLSERAALIMLAAWRGSALAAATRSKHRPTLYDDERQRTRGGAARPQAGTAPTVRTGTDGYKR
ncbi:MULTISPECIES: DUF2336 domain-containing protein [unclassified Bradyrhizobium]|uniref:DUF2336 domain-containing protein n=1 Tax=unclassified Bradyrhizobium TaxID=2631580 RepID=UPI0029167CFC|nr:MULTISPECIES: DUF2336 domain-containing protein [unclassified Bradyrhizobium]